MGRLTGLLKQYEKDPFIFLFLGITLKISKICQYNSCTVENPSDTFRIQRRVNYKDCVQMRTCKDNKVIRVFL